MGLRAHLEPKYLDPESGLRPDLLFTLPGRRILTDVAICHPFEASEVNRGQLGMAKAIERAKTVQNTATAAARHSEQLHFVADTCGGLSASAVKLIRVLAQTREEHLAVWSREDVIRQLLGAVAIAVQQGGAMAHLEDYDRCMYAMSTGRTMVRAEEGERGR